MRKNGQWLVFRLFRRTSFFRGILFRSIPLQDSELALPPQHFLPRNNGNRSESIPRNFFGTKFHPLNPNCVNGRRGDGSSSSSDILFYFI
jgi:hypothetical protein